MTKSAKRTSKRRKPAATKPAKRSAALAAPAARVIEPRVLFAPSATEANQAGLEASRAYRMPAPSWRRVD